MSNQGVELATDWRSPSPRNRWAPRPVTPILAVGAILGSASLAVVLANEQRPMSLAFLVLVGSLLIVGTSRLVPFAVYSPVWLLSIGLLLVAGGGVLLKGRLEASGGVGARIVLTDAEAHATLLLFCATVGFFLVGVAASRVLGRLVGKTRVLGREPRRWLYLVLVGVGPLLMLVAYGDSRILIRELRLPEPSTQIELMALTIGSAATLFSAGLVAWALASPRRVYARTLLIGVLGLDIVVIAGTGSRLLALIPPVVLVGIAVTRTNQRRLIPGAILAVVASGVLISTLLAVRGLPEHGLRPYVTSLVSAQTSEAELSATLDVANNVLVAFPLTGYVFFEGSEVSIDTTIASVHPGFGRSIGYYDMAPDLRVNRSTPYNAIGEIWRVGTAFAFIYFMAVGVVFGVLDRQIRVLVVGNFLHISAVLMAFALPLMFLVSSLQYNLRTATRYLYLGAIVSIGLGLYLRKRGSPFVVDSDAP